MAKQKRCEVCGCPVMSASECGGLCSPGCEAVYYQVVSGDFDDASVFEAPLQEQVDTARLIYGAMGF